MLFHFLNKDVRTDVNLFLGKNEIIQTLAKNPQSIWVAKSRLLSGTGVSLHLRAWQTQGCCSCTSPDPAGGVPNTGRQIHSEREGETDGLTDQIQTEKQCLYQHPCEHTEHSHSPAPFLLSSPGESHSARGTHTLLLPRLWPPHPKAPDFHGLTAAPGTQISPPTLWLAWFEVYEHSRTCWRSECIHGQDGRNRI